MTWTTNSRASQIAAIKERCAATPSRYDHTIRHLAAQQEIFAHRSRRDGMWYFSNANNYLESPEQGLSDKEALAFVLEGVIDEQAHQAGYDYGHEQGEDDGYHAAIDIIRPLVQNLDTAIISGDLGAIRNVLEELKEVTDEN